MTVRNREGNRILNLDAERSSAFWLCVILLFGFLIRIIFIDKVVLWGDEFYTLNYPSNHSLSSPLHYILTRSLFLFTDSVDIHRLMNVAWGLGSIILAFFMIKKLTGKTLAAFGVGLCLAVSPYFVDYTLELRPYPMFLFFSMLAQFSAILLVENRRRSSWIFFFAANILVPFSHLFGVLVIFFDILFISYRLLQRKHFYELCCSFLVLFGIIFAFRGAVLNFGLRLAEGPTAVHFEARTPSIMNIVKSASHLYFQTFGESMYPVGVLNLTAILTGMLVLCFSAVIVLRAKQFQSELVFFLVVPIVANYFLLDLIVPNHFIHSKYLIYTLPWLFLVVIWAALMLKDRTIGLTLISLFFLIQFLGLYRFGQNCYNYNDAKLIDWKAAKLWYDQETGGDATLLADGRSAEQLKYYIHKPGEIVFDSITTLLGHSVVLTLNSHVADQRRNADALIQKLQHKLKVTSAFRSQQLYMLLFKSNDTISAETSGSFTPILESLPIAYNDLSFPVHCSTASGSVRIFGGHVLSTVRNAPCFIDDPQNPMGSSLEIIITARPLRKDASKQLSIIAQYEKADGTMQQDVFGFQPISWMSTSPSVAWAFKWHKRFLFAGAEGYYGAYEDGQAFAYPLRITFKTSPRNLCLLVDDQSWEIVIWNAHNFGT